MQVRKVGHSKLPVSVNACVKGCLCQPCNELVTSPGFMPPNVGWN